jgi:hypothetical protein
VSGDHHDSLATLATLNERMRALLDQADRDLAAGRIDAETHRDFHKRATALEARHARILAFVARVMDDG